MHPRYDLKGSYGNKGLASEVGGGSMRHYEND